MEPAAVPVQALPKATVAAQQILPLAVAQVEALQPPTLQALVETEALF
jgi:hypothetical protein